MIAFTLLTAASHVAHTPPAVVPCVGETEPVATLEDAADDAAVWISPSDPAASVIVWTDKKNGLAVSDLGGRTLQKFRGDRPNNVDIVQGPGLDGIVFASDRSDNSVRAYSIDPGSRTLVPLAGATFPTGLDEVYGLCAYFDPARREPVVIVASKTGVVQVHRLSPQAGAWIRTKEREFAVGGQIEGMVADPERGLVYIGEEELGLWAYPLAPDAETPRRLIDSVRGGTNIGGNLAADVEGVTLVDTGGGGGCIVVSCQGEDRFAVYDRATLAYRGSFGLLLERADGTRDRVTHTDGIHAVSTPLGPTFPDGVFIAQDDNDGEAQNFKLARWGDIARALQLHAK